MTHNPTLFPTVTRFVMRQARRADFERLMEFYRMNATDALPAPSVQVLAKTLKESRGRIILIEPPAGEPIVACSAIFDFTPEDCAGYIGELSGTSVTTRLNGFGPLGVQRLLLGARLLGHVAAEGDAEPGNPTSLISIVKSDNRKSLANVAAAGLCPLDELPEWFSYEELSWNGAKVEGAWTYFLATDDTVRQAIAEMIDVGLFSGKVRLERTDRETGLPDVIEIEVRLPGLFLAERELRAILAGDRPSRLSPPPERLVLI